MLVRVIHKNKGRLSSMKSNILKLMVPLFLVIILMGVTGCIRGTISSIKPVDESLKVIIETRHPQEGEAETTIGKLCEWPLPYGSVSGNRVQICRGSVEKNTPFILSSVSPIVWMVASDINGDRKAELITLSKAGEISIIEVREDGAGFVAKYNLDASPEASPISTDLDGDGDKEVLAVSRSGTLYIINPEEGKGYKEFDKPRLSALTHPVAKDLDGDGKAEVIAIGAENKLYLLSYENGSMDVLDELVMDILLDARLTLGDIDGDGTDEVLVLSGPTTKYEHGALADGIEATRLDAIEVSKNGFRKDYTFELEDNSVFEALIPIIAYLDEGLVPVVFLTRSYPDKGGAIVALKVVEDDLRVVYESEALGTRFRWIHPIAVGDFDSDGSMEFLAVEKPHIGGVIHLYHVEGNKLVVEAQGQGFSSHKARSRNLDTAVVADFDGDEAVELLIPTQDWRTLALVDFKDGILKAVWSYRLEGEISSNIVPADYSGDGLLDLAVADDAGFIHILISGQ